MSYMENLRVLVQMGWSHLSSQDALCTGAMQQLPETLFKVFFFKKINLILKSE